MKQNLVVMGQGYVGLPLSQLASESDWNVVGFDVNHGVVENLNAGKSHVDDISDEEILTMIQNGYRASSDTKVLSNANVIVICVPTPLSEDGSPNLDYMKQAAGWIGEYAQPGVLIILESTTYPGTTENELVPAITKSGRLSEGELAVAFSPERIDPGNKKFTLKNTPKVVGGRNAFETQRAVEFYGEFLDTIVPVSNPIEAEMAKLLENTYRHVNIALVNEMAKFCHALGIDLWNVIEAAATKPFGFQAFYPGPGVGGHCIPIDPNYLSYEVKRTLGIPFRFVELAQEINQSMPQFVASRSQDILNTAAKPVRGSTILLVGVTYKANIADQRESPARPLAQILLEKGANVEYIDPFVPSWELDEETKLESWSSLASAAKNADLIILLQTHGALDLDYLSDIKTPVLDTRGVLSGGSVERL